LLEGVDSAKMRAVFVATLALAVLAFSSGCGSGTDGCLERVKAAWEAGNAGDGHTEESVCELAKAEYGCYGEDCCYNTDRKSRMDELERIYGSGFGEGTGSGCNLNLKCGGRSGLTALSNTTRVSPGVRFLGNISLIFLSFMLLCH